MLIIIRGAPGSGKSTIAKTVPNAVICEADQFRVDKEGNYRFKVGDNERVHESCQKKAFDAMEDGKVVVVANTFTKLWEMEPYISHAYILNIPVNIFRVMGAYPNIHNVPEKVVERMRVNYEPHPDEMEIRNSYKDIKK